MFENKPNWDDLPDKAKFIAMDEDGTWVWFAEKPRPLEKDRCWYRGTEGKTLLNLPKTPNKNWVQSLEERPMKIELYVQSPYNLDGTPRKDLPTCEVLAWDGKEWANGWLFVSSKTQMVCLCDGVDKEFIALNNVRLFAVLLKIIEQ